MKICGLDEVGRGALAGPLVAAGAILNVDSQISYLNDSKKLSNRQREKLYDEIITSGAVVAVEVVSARQINNRGIGWANKEVFRRLIKRLEADKYIVDGNLRIKLRGKTLKALSKLTKQGSVSWRRQ